MSDHDRDNDQGPGLVGALASFTTLLIVVAGIAWFVGLVSRSAQTPATVTTYFTAVIDGQEVLCTETFDPQTGARSRAC